MRKNSLGLVVGVLLSAVHVVWLALVATGVAKVCVDWVLSMHHMTFSYTVEAFDPVKGATLVVLTFVVGYVVGWVLAGLCNLMKKK